MIKKLCTEDHEELMEYLKHESEINLFIIGDIENYGYDSDFQSLWGEFNNDGKIIAVLLKYHQSLIFYSRDDFDLDGFCCLISTLSFTQISGKQNVIEKFSSKFDFKKTRNMYFCKLDNDHNLKAIDDSYGIKKLEVHNVEGIFKLHKSIDEFETQQIAVMKSSLESGRGYYVEIDGEIISAAQTTAENSASAMIVGVCTQPRYRKTGYASSCVSSVCKSVLDEGKTLCLYYNNPEAGKIYKRLGFYDIGFWTSYSI